MPNRSIGEYDMVFALSESKINAELKLLRSRGAIQPTWKFLTNLNSSGIRDIKTAGPARLPWEWMKYGTDPLESSDPEADWAAGRGNMRNEYQIKMEANLSAPTIQILPDSADELLFKVNITSGTLSYIDGSNVQQMKFTDSVYAFRVPIAQVRITPDKMYFAGEDALRQLREEGISDNDFTVDSIMLNFARADVADFIEWASVLPPIPALQEKLKVAMTSYFKHIGGDNKNPYVLGYAIKKKNLSPREKAMLYPTGVSFSTSFSKIPRCSTLNFLMLTEDRAFPAGEAAGKLRDSLMEYAQDTSATVSGVIAINYATFERTYLDALNQIVIQNFENSFQNNAEFADFYRGHKVLNSSNTHFEFLKPDMSMTMALNRSEVIHRIDDKTGAQYLAVDYIITVWGNVHAEVEQKLLGFINAGTISVEQTFSTNGQYPINEQTGQPGRLTLQIRASNEGKLSVEAEYDPPALGRNTEKPHTSKTIDDVRLVLSYILNPLGFVGTIINVLTDESGKNIVNFDNSLFKQISISSFDNLSSRVILPGSNVYTFKNAGMVGDRNNEDCYIKFDMSYAIATA